MSIEKIKEARARGDFKPLPGGFTIIRGATHPYEVEHTLYDPSGEKQTAHYNHSSKYSAVAQARQLKVHHGGQVWINNVKFEG